MACAPNEDSDQPGHPPSLIRVFTVRVTKAWVLSYPLSAQRRLWSDWVDAQAELSLHLAHISFCWFCHEVAHFLKPSHHLKRSMWFSWRLKATYFLPNAIIPYKTPVAKTRQLPNTVVGEKQRIMGNSATLKNRMTQKVVLKDSKDTEYKTDFFFGKKTCITNTLQNNIIILIIQGIMLHKNLWVNQKNEINIPYIYLNHLLTNVFHQTCQLLENFMGQTALKCPILLGF